MSVAIKCDWCGKYAGPPGEAEGWHRVEWYLAFPPPPGKPGDKEIPHIDLCKECMKKFHSMRVK